MYPQRQNPMDSFYQAIQAGLAVRQQREAAQAAREERQLRVEALQHEAKRLKLQDKMEAFKMMQGQRGPVRADQATPNLFSPGGQMPGAAAEGQLPEFDFSEIQPGLTMRPQSAEDVIRQKLLERQREMAMKGQELTQQKRIEQQFANPQQTVDVPGQGQVSAPSNVLPSLLQIIAQEKQKQGDREFTAGQNELNRTAEDVRSRRSSATTLQAAGMQAAATRASQANTIEGQLRDDFTKASAKHTGILDQVNNIHATAAEGGQGGDVLLVNAFNKLIDESVVREPEYARASGIGGAVEKSKAWIAQLRGTGQLTPLQRKELVKTADAIGRVARTRYSSLATQYSGIAARKGADPRNVILTAPDANVRVYNPQTGRLE